MKRKCSDFDDVVGQVADKKRTRACKSMSLECFADCGSRYQEEDHHKSAAQIAKGLVEPRKAARPPSDDETQGTEVYNDLESSMKARNSLLMHT